MARRDAASGGNGLRRLREELAASRLDALARSGTGVFLWDVGTSLAYVDPGGLALLQLDPAQYDGDPATLATHILREDVGTVRSVFWEAVAQGGDFGFYFRVRDGRGVRWLHVQATVRRERDGTARHVAGTILDASPRSPHRPHPSGLGTDRWRRNSVVRTADTALSRALTVGDVVSALTTGEVQSLVGAFGVTFGLVEGGMLRRLATHGLSSAYAERYAFSRLEERLPQTDAVRGETPLFLTQADIIGTYPELTGYMLETRTSMAAVLPLVAQGRAIGVLSFLFRDRHSLSPTERDLLLTLGAVVAQSVQRAVLYDEEREMATGLRQAVRPSRTPEFAGVRIAARHRHAAGSRRPDGDWYDVLALPGRRVGLVVGGVRGDDPGVPAAAGQVRSALRAYATEGHPPAAVLERASAFLRDLDAGRVADCLYAELDPATGRARLAAAGTGGRALLRGEARSGGVTPPAGPPLGDPAASGAPAPRRPVLETGLDGDEVLLLSTEPLAAHDARHAPGPDGPPQPPGADGGASGLERLADRLADSTGSARDHGGDGGDGSDGGDGGGLALLLVTRSGDRA